MNLHRLGHRRQPESHDQYARSRPNPAQEGSRPSPRPLAQILASLNHPNIAAIYGIEEAEGTRALVLELVEGPTLADRIAKGPVPLDEALPIAKQIAEALEVAHEAGVIHRDLKPANIKVRDDGTVKVWIWVGEGVSARGG